MPLYTIFVLIKLSTFQSMNNFNGNNILTDWLIISMYAWAKNICSIALPLPVLIERLDFRL